MASTKGFTQLDRIKKAIHELYRAFGPKHIESFNGSFALGDAQRDILRDPIIGSQYLAKQIANHYRLPVTTVVVTFSNSLQPPGRVELSQSNEFFVELQSQFQFTPKAIAAILAHEVAHIFLHRCGVRFPLEIENEILTDTTAVFVGFGPTIMNAATETRIPQPDGAIQMRAHHFGYMSMDEFGYTLARRDKLYSLDSSAKIDPGIALNAFFCGRSKYQDELTARPLVRRPLHERLSNWFSNSRFAELKRKSTISFACPICSQGLRIPEMHRKLSVNCPNCNSRFACYS